MRVCVCVSRLVYNTTCDVGIDLDFIFTSATFTQCVIFWTRVVIVYALYDLVGWGVGVALLLLLCQG